MPTEAALSLADKDEDGENEEQKKGESEKDLEHAPLPEGTPQKGFAYFTPCKMNNMTGSFFQKSSDSSLRGILPLLPRHPLIAPGRNPLGMLGKWQSDLFLLKF